MASKATSLIWAVLILCVLTLCAMKLAAASELQTRSYEMMASCRRLRADDPQGGHYHHVHD